MRVRVATNQKGVVLSKRKDAAFVRAGCDFQIDLHAEWLATHPLAQVVLTVFKQEVSD